MTDPFATPPPSVPASAATTPLYGAPLPARRNGMGNAARVLGILGVFPLTLLLLPAVLGIVFGVLGRRRVRRGEAGNPGAALTGLVCGIIGLVLGVVGLTALALLATSDAGRSYQDCMDAASRSAPAQQLCQDRLRRDLVGE